MNEASEETEQGSDEQPVVDDGNNCEQQLMTESDESKDEQAEQTKPSDPVSVRDPSAILSTSPPQANLLNGDGPVRRTKKRDLAVVGHPDKKSKLKHRKKKEFTKTNRSIIKYDCVKIINFD
jgi:hypothetical protein